MPGTSHDSPRRSARWWVAALAAVAIVVAYVAWPAGEPPPAPAEPPVVDLEEEEVLPSLAGRVVRRGDGGGVAGSRVQVRCELQGGAEVVDAVADHEGRFRFEELAEGRCEVTAAADGHVAGGPTTGRSTSVRIRDGESLLDLTLLLSQTGQIAGQARDGARPVPGVSLTLLYLEAPDEPESFSVSTDVVTDRDGRYRVSELLPGRIQILAEHEDYALVEGEPFFLHPGEAKGSVDISLTGAGSIQGRVVDRDGRGLGGVGVGLRTAQGTRRGDVLTDRDGLFELHAVPPGVVRLLPHKIGYDLPRDVEVEVVAGEVAEITIEARVARGVGGVVLDPKGAPVRGAVVRVEGADGRPLRGARGRALSVRSNAKGRFWLRGLSVFPVTIKATHAKHTPAIRRLEELPDQPIELRLGRGGELVGQVVDSAGRPVAAYRVYARRATRQEGSRGGARTIRRVADPSGRFHFRSLAPGDYVLEVLATDRPVTTTRPLEVVTGEVTDAGRITVRGGGVVVGQVVDADTRDPLERVIVAVEGGSIAGRRYVSPRTVTDVEGRFELKGLPEEQLSVTVKATRGYSQRLVSGVYVEGGRRVDLGVIALTPDDAGARKMQYSGVGMAMGMMDDRLVVRQVFEDSPAFDVGLEQGTEILAINGDDLAGMSLHEAVELIRGESGTEVTLSVLPPGAEYAEDVALQRGEITTTLRRSRRR